VIKHKTKNFEGISYLKYSLFHTKGGLNPLKPELNPIRYLLALLGATIFSTLVG